MNTIACPSCHFVNADAALESKCAQCGEPLAPAILQHNMDELKKLNEKMLKFTAPSFNTFNGFGTTLLDYRKLPDGTYEAVRWIVALFLPVFPLSAYVIQPLEQERTYGRETSRFRVLGQTNLSAARVARTYMLAVVGLAPIVLGSIYSTEVNRTLGGPKAAGAMILCFAWAVYFVFFRLKNEGKAYQTAKNS